MLTSLGSYNDDDSNKSLGHLL